MQFIAGSGLELVSYTDLTLHLPPFFRGMAGQIDDAADRLAESADVDPEYVDEHLYNIQCSEIIFTLRNEKLHTEA
jgi:hypothetical protein